MDLYHQEILEHYKHPHNHGRIENPDRIRTERNSSCGDQLTFTFRIDDKEIITDVQFEGSGCAISQASASLLTDEIIGLPVEKAAAFTKEDVLDLLGVDLGPTRLKCALLSLQGVTRALLDTKEQEKGMKKEEKENDL